MRKSIVALWLILILTLPGWAQPSLYIPNLGLAKQELHRWISSGQYDQELAQVNERARLYLEQALPGATRPALVLDIDETSLSNYLEMEETDFGYIEAKFDAWVARAQTPAIKPTLELFRYARAHQVACFFITGREESLRQVTERDLRQAGYADWQGLFLKPDTYKEPSIAGFKAGMRRQLTQQGYQILVNEGDQMSDLEGGYAQSSFKLPNPMYYIP